MCTYTRSVSEWVSHILLLCEVRAEAKERMSIDHMLHAFMTCRGTALLLACLTLCEVRTDPEETFEHITTIWQREYYGGDFYDGHLAGNW
jgi:hypothetical protein